ncbi:MAG: hypothetical protein U0931_25085 [Vulcanimicrobiota bacterium]
MTLYAALSDVPTALELFDRLLDQNVGLDQVSLLSQDHRAPSRPDSLHIPNFGRVWGLGSLSQASVLAAALADDGQVGLESLLSNLSPNLSRQLQSRYQGGETLMEVSIQGELEQVFLSAMLSAYGARLLSDQN